MTYKERSYLDGIRLTDEQQELALSVRRLAYQFAIREVRMAFARSYSSESLQVMIEDASQEAMMGVFRAAVSFDPLRQVKFSSYASWWIRRALQAGRRHWISLAESLGPNYRGSSKSCRRSRLYQFKDFSKGQAREEFLNNMSDEGKEDIYRNLTRAQPVLDAQDIADMKASVPPRWWDVIQLRTGGMTLEAIGEKMGFTKQRARQIEESALKRFRLIDRIRRLLEM